MCALPADQSFEIEYKFEVGAQVDLNQLETIFRAMDADFFRERSYETTIRYYDTADEALQQAGVILRSMDECQPYFKPEINVKTKGYFDAQEVLVREEYEFFPKGNDLDLSVIDNQRALDLLEPAKGKTLSEVFNTVTKRSDICVIFDVNGKKVAIDLALDDITFVAANDNMILRRAYESEIEFKQKFSDSAVTQEEASKLIQQMKQIFSQHVTLKPIAESRGETGFRLLRELNANKTKPESKNGFRP